MFDVKEFFFYFGMKFNKKSEQYKKKYERYSQILDFNY